jgi:hypothetical protein
LRPALYCAAAEAGNARGAQQIMAASGIMVQFLGWVAERPRTRGETLEGLA